jgi:hypothetical protein
LKLLLYLPSAKSSGAELEFFLNFCFMFGEEVNQKLLLRFHNLLDLLDWLLTLLVEAPAWAPGDPFTSTATLPVSSVTWPAASASTPPVC